jgi:hypothetical protein
LPDDQRVGTAVLLLQFSFGAIPPVIAVSAAGSMLYHEKQIAALCGVHCINTLLQGPYFSELDLAQVCAGHASVAAHLELMACLQGFKA